MAVVNIKAQVDEAVKEYLRETSHGIKNRMDEEGKKQIDSFYKGYKPKRHLRGDRLRKLLRSRIESHHERKRDIILDADADRLGFNYPKWVTPYHIYDWSFIDGGHGWLYNFRVNRGDGRVVYANARRGKLVKKKYKTQEGYKIRMVQSNTTNELRMGKNGSPRAWLNYVFGALKTGKGNGPAAPNRFKREVDKTIINPAMEKLDKKLNSIIENIFDSVLN